MMEQPQRTRREHRAFFVFFVVSFCAFLGLLYCPAACAQQRYEFSHKQMGTVFHLVFYAETDPAAETAAQAAFACIDSLNAHLSDYLPQSELNQLCVRGEAGEEITVSQELFDVLEMSVEVSAASEGAFDVAAGPLVQLWRRARRKHRLPEPDSVAIAMQSAGYEGLALNAFTCGVRLLRPAMRLDLGGIAKGYAADQVLDVLRRKGIEIALVDAGGDIAVGAPPPGAKGWDIAMETIDDTGERRLRNLQIAYAAVATSGDTYRYLEVGGKRYSHILDPRTGQALTDQCKVTVIAPTGTLADAWASAASVMGPARALPFAEACAWLEVHILCTAEDQARITVSSGLAD
jgi:thiamine biosynthesis lipoprotein